MQTLAVFLRTPRRHFREIGAVQTFAALFAMSSLLAGPLFGPFYGLRLARDALWGDLLAPRTFEQFTVASFSLGIAVFGTLAFVLPPLLGMKRRGMKAHPRLLLAPFYFALLSAAAWLALWEWTRKPFIWNKTDHLPRPKIPQAADAPQMGAEAKNLPASASAIKARVLSTP